jgi:hypothetical protein
MVEAVASGKWAYLVFVYYPAPCLFIFALVEALVFYYLVDRDVFEPRRLR